MLALTWVDVSTHQSVHVGSVSIDATGKFDRHPSLGRLQTLEEQSGPSKQRTREAAAGWINASSKHRLSSLVALERTLHGTFRNLPRRPRIAHPPGWDVARPSLFLHLDELRGAVLLSAHVVDIAKGALVEVHPITREVLGVDVLCASFRLTGRCPRDI